MSKDIDVNRGVMIQKHPSMGLVYMYIDEPGVFLNVFGKEVPNEIATQAGYDVKTLGKQKLKRERMASAMSAIELELELASEVGKEEVLWERGGYKVVGLPLGRAYVFDDEGNQLNPTPIPRQEAKVLLDHLVPKPKKKEKDDGGTAKEKGHT